MWSRSLFALALVGFVSISMAAQVTDAPPQSPDLHAVLLKAIEGTRTPAIAGMVLSDGMVTQEAVQGVRRNDGTAPALVGDVWLIGSDAKPMTATLLMKLVDRGLLSLDAPLADLLPELVAGMHPQYRRVTLRELLSHRSGLPEDTSDTEFISGFHTDARPMPAQRLAYLAHALAEEPVAAPDAKFSYSNTGFLVAAAIAERATGTPYEALMRSEVFEPLGMRSVGYGTTHEGQPMGHVGGNPVSKSEDSIPLMFAPAGNMHMSMRDWGRFCLDQLAGARGAGRLLRAQSYGQMQAAISGGASSLGWGVQGTIAGRKGPVLVHSGSDGNWYAAVVLFPETGQGVLVAANAGPDMGGDKAVMAALLALLPPR